MKWFGIKCMLSSEGEPAALEFESTAATPSPDASSGASLTDASALASVELVNDAQADGATCEAHGDVDADNAHTASHAATITRPALLVQALQHAGWSWYAFELSSLACGQLQAWRRHACIILTLAFNQMITAGRQMP